MKRKYFLVGLFLMLVIFLVGCNGNGGPTPPITPNQSPTASFTANPTSGVAPLEVTFNASSSSDSDGSIISYAWDFKDGETGNGETISHTFSSIGSYNVLLTVTDNDGATDTTTKTITVTAPITTNQSPTASFTATPTSGTAPLAVSFNASSSSDSDGSITSYAWDFKDGNTGTGQTINHTFSSAGSYNVLLTVTDDEGASDSTTKTINVTDPIIGPVPLGTPLTKDGITVTMERIEQVPFGSEIWGDTYRVETYFSLNNNSERVLKTGRLGPATGSLFYVLDEEIYEDEFNSIGYDYVGTDATSWVYPGQSRSIGYGKCFNPSLVTIKQITWTGTFADDQTEIELGPWEN